MPGTSTFPVEVTNVSRHGLWGRRERPSPALPRPPRQLRLPRFAVEARGNAGAVGLAQAPVMA
jgi:hypothetical protein